MKRLLSGLGVVPVGLARTAGRLPTVAAGAALVYLLLLLFRASGNSIIGVNINGDIHLAGQQIQSLHPDEFGPQRHHGEYDDDGGGYGEEDGFGDAHDLEALLGHDVDLPQNPYAHKGNVRTGHVALGYNDDVSWNRSDVVLVVAGSKRFGSKWVTDELRGWSSLVYMTDDPTAKAPFLRPGRNKGGETNVFLHYIIDNYHSLPEVMVFMHGHRTARHVDRAFENNVDSVLRLNLDHVHRTGFQSLHCGHDYVCDVKRLPRNRKMPTRQMKAAWPLLFPGDPIPPKTLISPPSGQFAVSKKLVLRNSKSDYERMHEWLTETTLSDADSDAVFEHTWPHIFGLGTSYCIERDKCMCEGFGYCDLETHMMDIGLPENPEVEKVIQQKQLETSEKQQHDGVDPGLVDDLHQVNSKFGTALLQEIDRVRKTGSRSGNRR